MAFDDSLDTALEDCLDTAVEDLRSLGQELKLETTTCLFLAAGGNLGGGT